MHIPRSRHPAHLNKGAAKNAASNFMSTPHEKTKVGTRRSKPGLSANCTPPSKHHGVCTKLECTCECHNRNSIKDK